MASQAFRVHSMEDDGIPLKDLEMYSDPDGIIRGALMASRSGTSSRMDIDLKRSSFSLPLR